MASYSPVKMAFKSFEPEDGADETVPVIFLHGAMGCKESWDDIPQKIANATKRKAYAVDARNHGETEWTDVFNFDCNVDDILHFMDTISAPKAILVGHSMGGVTCIKTSLRCPERIEKLVVEDAGVSLVAKSLLDMIAGLIALMETALETLPSGLDQASATKFLVDFILENVPPEVKKIMKNDKSSHRLSDMLRRTEDGRYAIKANTAVVINALKTPETLMAEPTGVYEYPACFIYGKKSPFPVLQDADNIKNHFPKAEFFGIDATHSIHVDCPEEFTETLLDFLLKE